MLVYLAKIPARLIIIVRLASQKEQASQLSRSLRTQVDCSGSVPVQTSQLPCSLALLSSLPSLLEIQMPGQGAKAPLPLAPLRDGH